MDSERQRSDPSFPEALHFPDPDATHTSPYAATTTLEFPDEPLLRVSNDGDPRLPRDMPGGPGPAPMSVPGYIPQPVPEYQNVKQRSPPSLTVAPDAFNEWHPSPDTMAPSILPHDEEHMEYPPQSMPTATLVTMPEPTHAPESMPEPAFAPTPSSIVMPEPPGALVFEESTSGSSNAPAASVNGSSQQVPPSGDHSDYNGRGSVTHPTLVGLSSVSINKPPLPPIGPSQILTTHTPQPGYQPPNSEQRPPKIEQYPPTSPPKPDVEDTKPCCGCCVVM